MLTLRGFSAWIVCDDLPVPEYLVAIEDHHRVSCWIPSEPGKQFSVHWQDHDGGVQTCAFITLDGFLAPGRFLPGSGTTSRSGVRSGPCMERPFVFQAAEDNTVSQEQPSASSSSSSASKSSAREVGMITLRIRRVAMIGPRLPDSVQDIPSQALGKRKPGDVYVGFGQSRTAPYQIPYTWSVKPYEGDGGRASSYVTFVFRYRTAEFLQTQGIMPESKQNTSATRTTVKPASRRVVSAPAIPLPHQKQTGSSLLLSPLTLADAPDLMTLDHNSGTTPKRGDEPAPPRTSSPPSSKKKKKTNQGDFLANGPYRLRRPSDMRRAVSWRAPNSIPSSQLSQSTSSSSSKPNSQSTTSREPVQFSDPFKCSFDNPSNATGAHSPILPSLPHSDEGTTDESSGEGGSTGSPTLAGGSSQEDGSGSSQNSGFASSPDFAAYYASLAMAPDSGYAYSYPFQGSS